MMHNLHKWRYASVLVLSGLLFLCGALSSAWAAPNDLHLHYLYNGRDRNDAIKNQQLTTARQKMFQNLSTELGFALAEPVVSPAETLGISGFDIGIQFTVSNIPELKEHWRRAVEDERPDNELLITRLRVRKGLGASFEFEGSVSFLNGSTSFLGGVALKWALNEGFYYFPDLAIRGSVNRLFSSRDMDMFTVTADIILSKQFSIVGTFTITPYASYSVVYVHTTSQVLDPTPKNFQDNEDSLSGASNFVFAPENIIGSRISFGARLVWYFASLTLGGAFTIPHFDGPEMVSMFNCKISFFF